MAETTQEFCQLTAQKLSNLIVAWAGGTPPTKADDAVMMDDSTKRATVDGQVHALFIAIDALLTKQEALMERGRR